jgi:hypothetical protein
MSDCPQQRRGCRDDSYDEQSWWFARSAEWKGYFARKLMESVPQKWSVWSSRLELGQAMADNGLLQVRHVNLSSAADQWVNASWIAPEDFYPVGSLADMAGALEQFKDVDCLYLSAHGRAEPGRFDTGVFLDGILGQLGPLVDQALAPSGMLFFTGCNVALRHSAALGTIAQRLHRPVVAATEWTRNLDTFPMGCRGVWIEFKP